MRSRWWVPLIWGLAFGCMVLGSGASDPEEAERAFPIVEPDPDHTKLHLAREGLEAIRRIKNPIAAVAVIGPYRSGKSFLLNQLLSLSCDKGFGVGHMRDTKTKGIWVWGTPVEMVLDGTKVSVVYLDTEGFESVGKSNVYDDRIFALATVLSSVLIYNLPETGQDNAFEPAKLLWLIQRDFLQGKSVQEMVNEAFRGDKYIDQILEALNKGEIPSTGSLVEIFNKVILERCLKVYNERMGSLGLPVPENKLQLVHDESKIEVRKLFDEQHFGRHHAAQSILKLEEEIQK
ncbi:Guanylate-binding protein 4, partial [Ananas comosus]